MKKIAKNILMLSTAGLSIFASTVFSVERAEEPKLASSQTVIEGNGYKLDAITYTDHNGVEQTREFYFISSEEGVHNAYLEADLPRSEYEELLQEVAEDQDDGDVWELRSQNGGDFESVDDGRPGADSYDMWIVSRDEAAIDSEQEALEHIERYDLQSIVDDELREDNQLSHRGNGDDFSTQRWFKKCRGWKNKNKAFSKSLNKPLSLDKKFGGSSANLNIKAQANLNAQLNVDVGYKYKRRWCIPYKFRLRQVDKKANYSVEGNFNILGQAQKSIPDQKWKVAEPVAIRKVFMAGPIPILVYVTIPIEIGTGTITVSAKGEINTVKPIKFNGDFHYRCYTQGCSKIRAYHSNIKKEISNSVGAGISASLKLDPYIHVAARGVVYHPWVFYVQIGAKPSFPIQLYGYYGNQCGDGNADGHFETVKAGFGTLDFKIGITAEAKIFNIPVLDNKYWKLWQTGLLFKDFINPHSSALSPVLSPEYTEGSPMVTLPVKVRSCVKNELKYHPRKYRVYWGDGQYSDINKLTDATTLRHTYSALNNYVIRVVESGGATSEVPVVLTDDDEW